MHRRTPPAAAAAASILAAGRIARVAAVIALAPLAWLAVRGQSHSHHRDRAGAHHACRIEELFRGPLTLESGARVYVEPSVLTPSSDLGSVLLAGVPNYVWSRGPAGRLLDAANQLLGVVLSSGGGVKPVRAPIRASRITGVRAVARERGGWWVVFGETEPSLPGVGPAGTDALHAGLFDGRRWRAMETLPLPAGTDLRPELSSSLVQYGDTLAWAVFERRPSPGAAARVLVFERVDGKWSYQAVPVGGVAYVELAHSAKHGLFAVIVAGDRSLPLDQNSLFLYARRPHWGATRKVLAGTAPPEISSLGSAGPVHFPRITRRDSTHALSWIVVDATGGLANPEARAMLGTDLADENGRVFRVDSSVALLGGGGVAPVPTLEGHLAWLSDHIRSPGERTLRISRQCEEGVCTIGEIAPYPFDGGFAGAQVRPGEFVIVGSWGPWRSEQLRGFPVTSGLLRVRATCGPD